MRRQNFNLDEYDAKMKGDTHLGKVQLFPLKIGGHRVLSMKKWIAPNVTHLKQFRLWVSSEVVEEI